MEQRKWIHPQVVPFNKFYLGSCYTQAYLPAFAALGASPDALIANNYSYFRIEGELLFIGTSYFSTQKELNLRFGLAEENIFWKVKDLPEFLVDQMKRGRLCLCRTDNPRATDVETGQRTAGSGDSIIHWLLIYGYDLDRRCFSVLEHRTNYSALYRNMEISFEELTRAYETSFASDVPDGKNLTLLWKHMKATETPTLSELLQQREKSRREIAPDSINALSRFYHNLVVNNLQVDPSQLLIRLNQITSVIRTEEFLLRDFGRERMFQDFIKYNNLLRSYAIKAMMGKVPKWENYAKYCVAIQHILADYEELCNEVLSC